jgi:putative DNA primase/helicase
MNNHNTPATTPSKNTLPIEQPERLDQPEQPKRPSDSQKKPNEYLKDSHPLGDNTEADSRDFITHDDKAKPSQLAFRQSSLLTTPRLGENTMNNNTDPSVDPLQAPSINNIVDLNIESKKQAFLNKLKSLLPEDHVYNSDSNRIQHVGLKKQGDEFVEDYTDLCSPLAITALTRSEDSKEGGLLLQWIDRGGNLRDWAMPQHLLAEDFKSIASSLQRSRILWLPVEAKGRRLFMDYLQLSAPTKTTLYTERTGWHDGSFVFPDHIIGDKEIIFQATSAKYSPPKIVGNVEDWQAKIGRYCVGNPTLVLGVVTALASPLAGMLGLNGFITHLIGASSKGKTLSLAVNCSIFGQEKGTWRGTDNAKEGEFEARNHIGTTLDELGQSSLKDVWHIVYMLANGQGKARANKDGSPQRIRQFNLTAISTGELSLTNFLKMGDKDVSGGLSVRFIEGVSDDFKYGCFDKLHEFKTGSEFATYISKATGINGDIYNPEASGALGIEFIKILSERLGGNIKAQAAIKEQIQKTAKKLIPENADSQVSRMAESMALLIVAGELATKAGLTGWSEQTATKNITRWWNECVLPTRGGTGATEDDKALEQVKDYFELHHISQFIPMGVNDCKQPMGNNRPHDGYSEVNEGETTYYVTSAGFKNICRGYEPKRVAQACIRKGWLKEHQTGDKTETTKAKRVGGLRPRFYWFKYPSD